MYESGDYLSYALALHAAALAAITGEPLGRPDGFSRWLEVTPLTAAMTGQDEGEEPVSGHRGRAAGGLPSSVSLESSDHFSVDVDAVEASIRAARNFAGVIAGSLAQADEVTLPQLRVLVLAWRR